MAFVVPPSRQYQQKMVPLRGLWNRPPAEGDKFTTIDIQWLVTTDANKSVQISLGDISSIQFSQIVALNVDNTRNNAEVQFLFPDSGYQLVVPPFAFGVYPVFTNALSFYIVSKNAVVGSQTIVQVLNSMPPPVALQSSRINNAGVSPNVSMVDGITNLVSQDLTLRTFSLSMRLPNTSGQSANIILQNLSTLTIVWSAFVTTNGQYTNHFVFVDTNLLPCPGGLRCQVTGSTIVGGSMNWNLYYETLA